ncbi:MAG: hypothetical protein ACLPVW_12260 [Terriglobales bacterium]
MHEKIPPERYWHCAVTTARDKETAIENDLTFSELQRKVVEPWLMGRPFTVSGRIIRSSDSVSTIKITHTTQPQEYYANAHDSRMQASGIMDMATDRRYLPLSDGQDFTFDLLFSGQLKRSDAAADVDVVERVCRRIGKSAQILCNRSRKGKESYVITNEYDVQDLLHATLRAYLKYSVQEDPLPKLAGAKSGRADISIEELGLLIEVKYVHSPDDQKRLFNDFSQDLFLYAQWVPLKTLFYLIYNSSDLRDAEALEKLSGDQEIKGKRFHVQVLLV